MAGVTLQVPAEHADHFRVALIEEVAWDIDGIRRERKTVEEFRFHQEGERRAVRAADLRDKIRQLEHDAALMRQIDLSGTGAVEISTDDPAAPSHICELVDDLWTIRRLRRHDESPGSA